MTGAVSPITPQPAADSETKAGQRRVNLIWEITQATIALMITAAVIYCTIIKTDSRILENAFFLIVSMYYVRTNHTLIGGTGAKPPPQNQQR